MPALVNISVGSWRGTSGLEGMTSWLSLAKNSRKLALIALVLASPAMVRKWLTLPGSLTSGAAALSLLIVLSFMRLRLDFLCALAAPATFGGLVLFDLAGLMAASGTASKPSTRRVGDLYANPSRFGDCRDAARPAPSRS